MGLGSGVNNGSAPAGSTSGTNPLSVLGPVLFPPGNSNVPVEQLRNYYLQQLSGTPGVVNFNDSTTGTSTTGLPLVVNIIYRWPRL